MTIALATTLTHETHREAARLLTWWAGHLPDPEGGFHGEVDAADCPVPGAAKSVILNTRLLWYFSAMARESGAPEALPLAARAKSYLIEHFFDENEGGVYWLLDSDGDVKDGKKQAYAQAFAVYALTEYHLTTGDPDSLQRAHDLQDLVEARYWHEGAGGYIEALGRDWQHLTDQRLSEKDLDAPKTMNTHLHILEAYTHLHRVAQTQTTRQRLSRILTLFLDRFVGADGHLRLFFDLDWTDRTHAISYGHDIEASWLIWEAAAVLGDDALLARSRPSVLSLARTTLNEGMTTSGALSHDRSADGQVDPAGEWWGQAEALVGFVNAWQMTADPVWIDAAERVWDYTKVHYGAGGATEWSWYAAASGHDKIYKAGMWKCPYHNGRAMIELIHRLTTKT